ncbi:MAG: amidase [Pseudomonadota bacterium]
MSLEDLAFESTSNLARHIAKGDVTSMELVDLFAGRHDRFGGTVNAVVQTDFDRARTLAKDADQALADGKEIEPLHGVPFTIKECYEVAGFKATAGAPELAGHTPGEDADAVKNLHQAGAICMGKTNVPYMAFDLQSFNDVYGTTNNPWDVTRTCGGSSGGSAAALAAGLTGGDIGSDIGGSLRNPAHYNGIYSHKPTFALVPEYGHIPPAPGTVSRTDLSVMGPMGRSADDLKLLLDVLMRPVGLERNRQITLPKPRKTQLEDFRVAIWPGHHSNRPSRAIAERMDALSAALTGNVEKFQEAWPLDASYEELVSVYAKLLLGAVSSGTPALQFAIAQAATPFLSVLKAIGVHNEKGVTGQLLSTAQSHKAWALANETRARMRREIDRFFEQFDVLLMPVIPWTAPKHDHSGTILSRTVMVDGKSRPYTDALDYIALATALYLPSTVAPIGLASDGLPVGVQIVGPYMHDATTIAFAQALGEVIGGYVPPPDFKDASAPKSP